MSIGSMRTSGIITVDRHVRVPRCTEYGLVIANQDHKGPITVDVIPDPLGRYFVQKATFPFTVVDEQIIGIYCDGKIVDLTKAGFMRGDRIILGNPSLQATSAR